MSSNTILSQSLIVSGRDIPLKELLFAKRVLNNYMLIALDNSPAELLAEMKHAVNSVDYFKTDSDPCEARNAVSAMFKEVEAAESFEDFKSFAAKPSQALHELIEDRAQLIKQERDLLRESGYDVSKI
ncbi:conserved hypothetical protein [Vibrio nigripulchritudo MADA3029]|uniref:Uncharacterized protein n=2 Tax=Vibrio nigripulchritudo TaxID=28173 RepID=U4KDY3_9VIBR|nr:MULTISPECIES: hypothetical protein [Vibrio]EGU61683.1 hypothetical protein VINI7043_21186 [Vibrio nigripulchritudo ATCC 27043]KJY75207.1 hypothetical protein TW74_17890 [Vibrio nigripulchritudo]UAB72705.1 hypothetical protein INR79_25985 [Vibrio sp. SCSIO 43132]CCN38268.1 conserved hypothetical protein [Vibrio nigripulchritudo AM115]CCN43489.1 conserved hypothetical protein [Vibrio nigripulchritudo FTn2]